MFLIWVCLQLIVFGAYLLAQLFYGRDLGIRHWGEGAKWAGETYWAQGTSWTIGAKGAWCTTGHCAGERNLGWQSYIHENIHYGEKTNTFKQIYTSYLPLCLAVLVPLEELFLCSPSNTSCTLQNSFWMCLWTSLLWKMPGKKIIAAVQHQG